MKMKLDYACNSIIFERIATSILLAKQKKTRQFESKLNVRLGRETER